MENKILLGIILLSAVVFVVATIYYYPEVFRRLICRAGFGAAGIWGANQCLAMLGIGWAVGINPLTILVLTLMGGPGLLLLYGVEVYGSLFL